MAILILPIFAGVGLGEGVSVFNQIVVQATGIISTVIWTVLATTAIVLITKKVTGLRVDDEDEIEGLDYKAHGETGYKL